jgi:hypothetical protein
MSLRCCFTNRQQRVRLAKHGTEASTDVDLPKRRTSYRRSMAAGPAAVGRNSGGDSGAPVPAVGVSSDCQSGEAGYSYSGTQSPTMSRDGGAACRKAAERLCISGP